MQIRSKSTPRAWKRYWRWLLLGTIVLSLYLFRGCLLRSFAVFLVSEDLPGHPGVVLILGPGLNLLEVARLCDEEKADGVLLVSGRPSLAQRLGAVPIDEAVVRKELPLLGVTSGMIQTLSITGESDWNRVRCLGEWLDDHPNAQVTFLCGRFQGRRWRYLLTSLLSSDAAARVRLRPMSHPDYDETNWWHNKKGQLAFFGSLVSYLYVRFVGEGEERPPWDPDQYEKSLQARAQRNLHLPHAGFAGNVGLLFSLLQWLCG